MSTQKSKKPPSSRAAKRAQFSKQEKKSSGASPLVLIAGLVVVVAIIGGVAFALTRPSPTDTSASASTPSSAVDSYGSSAETLLVRAATQGHDPYPQVKAEDGVISLPLSAFDDHKAHHFTYMNEGRPIEFFVLKSNDGVVRAAFNACDVCFGSKKGYTQDGDVMICNNCGRRFPANQINVVHGGCNPSPLAREVDGDTLIIEVEDLITGQGYF